MRADARIRLWRVICAVTFAVALVAGGAAQNVQAKLITFNFEGDVTYVGDKLLGTFNVGDKLSGSYTFDSATPDIVTDPVFGDYYALKALNFTVGTYTGTLGAGTRVIEVVNNYTDIISTTDWYRVLNNPFSGPNVGGLPPSDFLLYLQDTTAAVFSSDALPITPPDLSLFDEKVFDVRFGPCDNSTAGECNLMGTITSLTLGISPDTILEFFDDSVDNGDLSGSGPGKSANNRLNALRNMVEEAGALIEGGFIAEACRQLMDAYKKTDGKPRPPDFVEGDAAPDLATMIQDLRAGLGCQQ